MDNNELANKPVRVTAEERAHPALAKLARACIALARLNHPVPAEPSDSTPDEGTEPPASAVEGHV